MSTTCNVNPGHLYIDRALKFRKVIDSFVGITRELRYLELEESEWDAIAQVADWLRLFRLATTQMSKTKGSSMLSSTHAIFRGLQDHIANIIRHLPDSTSRTIKTGLLEAHRKLSDYYFKCDQSPLYTWAACKLYVYCRAYNPDTLAVLDPRISYDGMREDYCENPDLLKFLEKTTSKLREYYTINYATATGTQRAFTDEQPRASSSTDLSPSKVSFTARYKRKDNWDRDELSEYFKLPREDWELCNPLQWWVGRRAQFPRLFCLARDLLAIPGMSQIILMVTILTYMP